MLSNFFGSISEINIVFCYDQILIRIHFSNKSFQNRSLKTFWKHINVKMNCCHTASSCARAYTTTCSWITACSRLVCGDVFLIRPVVMETNTKHPIRCVIRCNLLSYHFSLGVCLFLGQCRLTTWKLRSPIAYASDHTMLWSKAWFSFSSPSALHPRRWYTCPYPLCGQDSAWKPTRASGHVRLANCYVFPEIQIPSRVTAGTT